MRIEFPGVRFSEGIPLEVTKDITIALNKKSLTLRYKNYLPVKTSLPILPGQTVEGWFSSEFADISSDKVYGQSAVLVVEFTDVTNGSRHSIRQPLNVLRKVTKGNLSNYAD